MAEEEALTSLYDTYMASKLEKSDEEAPVVSTEPTEPAEPIDINELSFNEEQTLGEIDTEQQADAQKTKKDDSRAEREALLAYAAMAEEEEFTSLYDIYMEEKMAKRKKYVGLYDVSEPGEVLNEEDIFSPEDYEDFVFNDGAEENVIVRESDHSDLEQQTLYRSSEELDEADAIAQYEKHLEKKSQVIRYVDPEPGEVLNEEDVVSYEDLAEDFVFHDGGEEKVIVREAKTSALEQQTLRRSSEDLTDAETLSRYEKHLEKKSQVIRYVDPEPGEVLNEEDIFSPEDFEDFTFNDEQPTEVVTRQRRAGTSKDERAELAALAKDQKDRETVNALNLHLARKAGRPVTDDPTFTDMPVDESRVMGNRITSSITASRAVRSLDDARDLKKAYRVALSRTKEDQVLALYEQHLSRKQKGKKPLVNQHLDETAYYLTKPQHKELASALPHEAMDAKKPLETKAQRAAREAAQRLMQTHALVDLQVYLRNQKKQLGVLNAERLEAERRQKKAARRVRVAILLEKRNIIAERAAVLCDVLDILRSFPAEKRTRRDMAEELRKDLRRYNATSTEYRNLTKRKLSSVKMDLPERILGGKTYEKPKLAEVPSAQFGQPVDPEIMLAVKKPETVFHDAKNRETIDEGDRKITRKSATQEHLLIEHLNRHEYAKFIQAKKKELARLERQIVSYEHQLANAIEDETKTLILFEILTCRRCIVNDYIEWLKMAISCKDKRAKQRRLAAKIQKNVKCYNAELARQSKLTKERYPKARTNIGKRILQGKPYRPLSVLNTHGDLFEQLAREKKLRDRQKVMKERQEKIDRILNKRHEKKIKRRKQKKETLGRQLTQKQLRHYEKLEKNLIRLRYEEMLAAIDSDIVAREEDYTAAYKRKKQAKDIRVLKLKRDKIRMMRRRALKSLKKDNKRYYKILKINFTTFKPRRKKTDVEYLADIQTQLYDLIGRRTEVDRRLCELYTGSPTMKNRSVKLRRIYNRRLRFFARIQWSVAQRINNLRNVTQQQKQQLYKFLNQKTRLEAEIATARPKCRLYHLSGAARRAEMAQRKKKKKKLIKLNRKINFFMKVRVNAAKRYVPIETKIAYGIALVYLIAMGVLFYLFRDSIIEIGRVVFGLLTKLLNTKFGG